MFQAVRTKKIRRFKNLFKKFNTTMLKIFKIYINNKNQNHQEVQITFKFQKVSIGCLMVNITFIK